MLKYKIPQIVTLTPDEPLRVLGEDIFLYVFRMRKRMINIIAVFFVRILSDLLKGNEDK